MVGGTVRRGSKTVLRELDLRINESEVVCIVGDNGSGKSTLLETLAGLHPLREGKSWGQLSMARISLWLTRKEEDALAGPLNRPAIRWCMS